MQHLYRVVKAGRRRGNGQRYEPVPSIEEVEIRESQESQPSCRVSEQELASQSQRSLNFCGGLPRWLLYVSIGGALLFLYWAIPVSTHSDSSSCDTWQQGFTCRPKISQFWGQYSPYFRVPSDIPLGVPDQCQVTFVQALSRHGARDPTASKSHLYKETIENLQAHATSYSREYAFIKDFKYALGSDQLSVFGQNQMVNSGLQFYHRYQDLARQGTPFIRAASKARVVQSAQNWTQGFHNGRLADIPSADDDYPYSIVVINEGAGQNNTLDHGLCTAFEDLYLGEGPQQQWENIFVPSITGRLNQNLPGANLTDLDTISIMDLCPFITVANPTGQISPFCALFTEEEWSSYNYFQSLGKYYGYGWGNPLGATQGVGFTNELIARLTATPVNDHTSTNHTLDDSRDTFPVGGKTVLYADFTHDNDLTGIFSAMGLYNETRPLSNDTFQDINETKGYSAAWTVPFASRAYFEKMICAGQEEEYVRVVVNDRVLPLTTCGGDELGRCSLSAFVDGLSFARSGGNWDQCFI